MKQSRVEGIEHACYNRWSAEIKTYQLINQKTRLYNFIYLVIPLNTPGWVRIRSAMAIACFYFCNDPHYVCCNLVYQTDWAEGTQCFWRPQSVEGWSKADQCLHSDWCQQLASGADKVIMLNKFKELPNTDKCGTDIMIISWHWCSLPEE